MGSRVENVGGSTLLRVSHATLRASWAAVAGHRKASATSSRGRGSGGCKAWIGVLFCHECFETSTLISDGNEGTRQGIRLRDGQSPPGLVSGCLSFRLRVAVAVQFSHQDGGLGVRAWAGDGIARRWAHAL